jgi:anti-sigma B factor antagonist
LIEEFAKASAVRESSPAFEPRGMMAAADEGRSSLMLFTASLQVSQGGRVRLYLVEKMIDDVLILDVRGRITLGEETEALRNKISECVKAGQLRVLVDLGEVTYIDSAGLSTLVAGYTTVRRQGGNLKLLNLTKRVHDLLQITRLSTVFEMYNALPEALASFGPRASTGQTPGAVAG